MIGVFVKGWQFLVGNFLFVGYLVVVLEILIWDFDMFDFEFEEDLYGFVWFDDFVVVGDMLCCEKVQFWVWCWIDCYGKGDGLGWMLDFMGWWFICWINYVMFLL